MSLKSLGISGRYRHAAAALAVDGCVVAASSEDSFTRVPGIGYSHTGGFPSQAVDACLRRAGLELGEIDRLTIVDDESLPLPSPAHVSVGEHASARIGHAAPVVTIGAVQADAIQTAACDVGAKAVLIGSAEPPALTAFVFQDGRLKPHGRPTGAKSLVTAARAVAARLGLEGDDPYRALDRLSFGAEPEFQDEFAAVMGWHAMDGVATDQAQLAALVGSIGWQHGCDVADAASSNVRVQALRRALAASFICCLAAVVRALVQRVCDSAGVNSVAFGGAMFANMRLTAELRRSLAGISSMSLAAVPELPGRALGAALAASDGARDLAGLALGPAFSENEIKQTLDNCRLDYVYEPDWPRLVARTSKMLSQGKVIAWFQGAMGFGPRALGTRSILCDPSQRYARANVNEYLRQTSMDEPLPVVFAASMNGDCLVNAAPQPFTVLDAAIKPEWSDKLSGALDGRRQVRVQALAAQATEFSDLLEHHYARTGVPALVETNLSGPGEPVACTPRDAVRTMYASAIDALVIGRFLLMKDYWLLRAYAD